MKTAEEWKSELAGTNVVPVALVELADIKAIQLDALTHASQTMTAYADRPERAFHEILDLINQLHP